MAIEMQEVQTDYRYGFHDPENYVFKSGRGLSREVVEQISEMKGEPDWMRQFRLKSLEYFNRRPMPNWGADLSTIDFGNIFYYVKPSEGTAHSWEDVPEGIKSTYDKLGIPEAEKKFLAGVGAQYESETIYHKLRDDLAAQGVIFLDTGEALKQHPELFRKYFATVIPPNDNKFAALNSAVWSGGLYLVAPRFYLLGVIYALIYTLSPVYNVVQFSYRLALIPDALQGRVNSSFRLLAFGFNPLGAALCGLLLERAGSTPTVLLFAACYVAMAVLTQINPQVRNARPLAETKSR